MGEPPFSGDSYPMIAPSSMRGGARKRFTTGVFEMVAMPTLAAPPKG
jgi:hypothetical protein